MQTETEKLLGTLEILSDRAFVWETEKEEELNLWHFILSQVSVKETDLDLVIKHWQNIEIWGTPTDQKADGYEYAPYREERKDDDWNDDLAKERQKYYRELQKICQKNFKNLQAYILLTSSSEWGQLNFYISIIVAQTGNNNWICLAPVVEDLCCSRKNMSKDRFIENIQDIQIDTIDSILNKLTPITLYDYYYGGYNQTHQHQIIKGVGTTKEKAIALALQESGMIVWQTEPAKHYGKNSDLLNKFMNQCLQDRACFRISFWGVCYIFDLGKTPVNDWIGIKNKVEFEYNP